MAWKSKEYVMIDETIHEFFGGMRVFTTKLSDEFELKVALCASKKKKFTRVEKEMLEGIIPMYLSFCVEDCLDKFLEQHKDNKNVQEFLSKVFNNRSE